MAGEGTKRIIDLTEAAETQSGDYIAIDSTGRGTRKLPAGFMATAEDLSEEQTARQTADATLDGKITTETQARIAADNALGDQITALDEKTEADAALIQNPTKTVSGSLCSFTDGADMPMVACTAEIVPKQSGSGTPSPENVRPISGWESVSVNVSGKNLIDVADQTITSQRTIASNITLESGTYTVGTNVKNNTAIVGYFRLVRSGTVIAEITVPSNANERRTATFTLSESTTFNIVCNGASSGYNYAVSNIMCEHGSTATEYEPYTLTTTTTDLGRTVYGGTLDVVTGMLTVDKILITPTAVDSVRYDTTRNLYWCTLTISPKAPSDNNADLISNMFESYAGLAVGCCYVTSAGGLIVFIHPDQTLTTKEAMDAWLADNDLQFCYLLRTPQTYTLTGQEVSTLLGDNNVWADSGDVEITYRRDISIVINNLESALNG